MKKIRRLLIEDNRLLRDGIAAMLKEQRDIRVIAASRYGENTRLSQVDRDCVKTHFSLVGVPPQSGTFSIQFRPATKRDGYQPMRSMHTHQEL